MSDRSGLVTFIQAESGKTASVSLSQTKGVEGWNYTFSVSPISLLFEAIGGTKNVSVTSFRRQTINGSETGVQENVGYSSSVSGDGFSSNGTEVAASENTYKTNRIGRLIFIQDFSGRSVAAMLQQLGIPTYELCINIYNQNPPNIDRYDITVDGDSQNADSGRYDQLEYIRDIAEGSIVEIGLNGVTDYMLDFPKEYVTDEYERRPPYRLEGVTEKRLFVRYDDPYVIRIIMK